MQDLAAPSASPSAKPLVNQGALQSALVRQLALANKQRSMLFPFIGRSAQFQAWQHYPGADALDASGAWQFYYHAHDNAAGSGPASDAAGVRHPQEHGHIHLFRRNAAGQLSHLCGLALDARGTPLCWFACNQWVTGERWRSARAMGRGLQHLQLRLRGPLAGVALWLADLVRGYAQPLRQMLVARDAALAQHCAEQQVRQQVALADRSIAVWSAFPIQWPGDAVALQGSVFQYGNTRRVS
jgi:hypothetical protein